MVHTWSRDRAAERIKKRLQEVKTVSIINYTRDLSLESIPSNKAYRMKASHLYIDILNLRAMLHVTENESETCHKRTLRFLDLQYRAIHRALSWCDALRVDFHNQRLHAVIAKPYDSEDSAEAKRIDRAVAITQLITDVLQETGDDDEHIPNPKIRVGIDSGEALAVNNGRSGGREPLFLGNPANRAAKLSGGGSPEGIYLTNHARNVIGLPNAGEEANLPLTAAQIKECQDRANLGVTSETIIEEWRTDLADRPIGTFKFFRHTPPLRTLDISVLTPGNSRRQEAVSLYADIAGFTAFVAENIGENSEDVVRIFHVIRAELDAVLMSDFDGRRIRFIGDCIHGLQCEGTDKTTDEIETISAATLCAGALRSSFELALEKLEEAEVATGSLGLSIGFEYGPMTVSRLGMQGDRTRCSVSRGVLASEVEQERCSGDETAVGPIAYGKGSDGVRALFGKSRKVKKADYNEVVEELASAGDQAAGAAKKAAFAGAAPAIARSADVQIRPHTENE